MDAVRDAEDEARVRAEERADDAREVVPVRLLAVAPFRDVVLDAMSPKILCEGQRYRRRFVRLHCG